jgi:hypothetical protein
VTGGSRLYVDVIHTFLVTTDIFFRVVLSFSASAPLTVLDTGNAWDNRRFSTLRWHSPDTFSRESGLMKKE